MKRAETIISKADTYLNKDNNRQIKDAFLEKYSKCEVLCRPVLRSYLKEIGEYTSDEEIGMELQLIKAALYDASYVFDDSKLLTRIWGKGSKKGESSCRFLRNKITHELMERALHEVVERQAELNADMDLFIDVLLNN
ncbi:MAG: hypothetical protein LUD07_11345 [Clostridiales bacterium]|nr:hypothetical protein [Clostridiales bacterium]